MSAVFLPLPLGEGWGEGGLRVREPSAKYLAQAEPALLRGFESLATAPGGVAKLRALIHSLAVRGLLVPHEPSDEPATALLQRLVVKQATTGKGTLGTGDVDVSAAPYEVPAHWAWAPLSQLVENMGSGWSPACDEGERADPTKWAVLRTTAVQVMEYRPQEHKTLPAKLIGRPAIEVKDGDILITRAGPMNRVGISCWVDQTPPRLMLSDKIVRFHATDDEMLPAFIVLALNAGWTKDQLEDAKTGMAASQVNISQSDLRGMLLPVCSKAEQHRIVARVEELMKLCDALEQSGRLADEQHARLTSTLFDALAASESAHALAENWQRVAEHFDLLLDRPEAIDALEQTILQLAVRGLLVPQDAGDESASCFLVKIRSGQSLRNGRGEAELTETPYEVPAGWQWCTLETISQIGTGTTPSRTNALYFEPPEVPWVTSGETGRPFIAATAQAVSALALRDTSLKVYPVGTLIVAMYGQGKTRGQISELLIAATTNQACAAIVPIEPTEHHRRYIKLFFEKSYDELREQAAGGAQPNLNAGKIKTTLIPLPPLAEQHRIVTRVQELRQLCARLRERLTEARETQAFLADALVMQAIDPNQSVTAGSLNVSNEVRSLGEICSVAVSDCPN